ncbi:unnamed protein product [Jaminaea pallidilutea]
MTQPDQGQQHDSRTPGPYSAVGSISAAFSSWWAPQSYAASSTVKDSAVSRPATSPSSSSQAAAHTVNRGWGTGYFFRQQQPPKYQDAGDTAMPHENSGQGQEGAAWQIGPRSPGQQRKRNAIPFGAGAPTHSRVSSDASNMAAGAATPSQPLRSKRSETAMASLARLKAQGSVSSLRSAALDSSFVSVSSSFNSPARGGQGGGLAGQTALDRDLGASSSTFSSAAHDLVRPGASPPKDWHEALTRTALLDSYVHRIVYQSGTDRESRPMILLSSSALPDPQQVDYDALLERIMDQMDLFVQNDYTVVFFASGSKHRPPWKWIWSSYRRLSRPFRKNCRRLFICHPTFFTRTLVRIVSTGSAVLSPKFAKKITQVNTLSELASHVDLTQMDIPPEVLQWNTKLEPEIKLPRSYDGAYNDRQATNELPKVFGAPLQQLMGEKGEKGGIPRVVRDCVEALQRTTPNGESPLDAEGIFRKSPSAALLRTAQQAYDRGNPVSLDQYDDPHIPAALLKQFFRSLPDPIFPASLYSLVSRHCPPICENDEESMREVLSFIRGTFFSAVEPPSKLLLLAFVAEVLHQTALRSDRNRMHASNLATVWAPTLVRSNDAIRDMTMCRVAGPYIGVKPTPTSTEESKVSPTPPPATLGTLLKICIERYYEVFEFDDLDYEPPMYDLQGFVDALPDAGAGEKDGFQTFKQGHGADDTGAFDAYVAAMRSPLSVRRKSSTAASPARPASGQPVKAHPALPSSWKSPPTSPTHRSISATSPEASSQHFFSPTSPTRNTSARRQSGTGASSSSSKSMSLHSGSGGGGGGSSGLGLGFGPTLRANSAAGLGNPMSVGRTASGSLRLTKARVGSFSASGGSSGAATANVGPGKGGRESGLRSSGISQARAANDSSQLFGATSGLTLTGASARGLFTTSSGGTRSEDHEPTEPLAASTQETQGGQSGDTSLASTTASTIRDAMTPSTSMGSIRSESDESASDNPNPEMMSGSPRTRV